MSSGVNTPSPLLIGNLSTTPSVAIGVGGLLTVNNTTGTPSVSIAGPLTSSSSLTLPAGTAATPSLNFTGATTSGLSTPSAGVLSMSVAGVPVQDWGATGPVSTTRSQQWTVGSVASTGSGTALAFTTPSATPASLTGYLTYAGSSVNGDTWTIVQGGLWAIKAVANATTAAGTVVQVYLTNGGSSTTLPTTAALTPGITLDYTGSVVPAGAAGGPGTSGGVFFLPAAAVVRAHLAVGNAAGATITTAGNCSVTFTFLGATATAL